MGSIARGYDNTDRYRLHSGCSWIQSIATLDQGRDMICHDILSGLESRTQNWLGMLPTWRSDTLHVF